MTDRGGRPSFGDVTGEYLALRDQAAWVAPWHDLVWVRGPDTVRFLDGLVSQAVEPLAVGDTARSLLLAPQGKLRAPHLILRGADEVGLLTDHGSGETIVADLTRFKIRVDVVIEAESAPVVDIIGAAAPDVVAGLTGEAAPEDGWRRSGDLVVVAAPFPQVERRRFVVVGAAAEQLEAVGVQRAGRLAMDAVRIEAGEPVMGVDIDDGTIAQEADLVAGAVDFTKGCYLGQELIARIDSRGHVNRRLRGLRLLTNIIPPFADVVVGDKLVGHMTSVAESLDLGAPIGLALLRREIEPGDAVELRWDEGHAEAVVHALPFRSGN